MNQFIHFLLSLSIMAPIFLWFVLEIFLCFRILSYWQVSMRDLLCWIHFWGRYFKKMFMILINFLFPNRNRFLIGKGGELPTNLNNYESVNTIKFIGLQHSFLTDVIDQINNCYSLQVRKRSMNFQNSILGF